MTEVKSHNKHPVKASPFSRVSPGQVVGLVGLLLLAVISFRSLPGLSCSSSRSPAAADGSSGAAKPEVVVVVGAPVLGQVDLSLLQHVLPLTNFSALPSAPVLDSAIAAGSSPSQLRQLMQFQQGMFCSARMHEQELAGVVKVPFGNVSLYVYDGHDIVSNQLKGKDHSWEEGEVQEMLWALRQHDSAMQQQAAAAVRRPLPGAAAAAAVVPGHGSSGGGGSSQPPPMFVDIGANVGWFMLNAAAAGAKVAAFEAMSNNVALLRRSLCSNPWLAERIALFGTGLGVKSSTCHIVSGATNRGDGLTICDQDVQEALTEFKKVSNETYEPRGEITIRRLDTLLAEDVQVMKIDVEGFELQVLEGAEQLLANHHVWHIMAECNRNIIGTEGQKRYLKFLDRMGYAISTVGFRGPYLPYEAAASGNAAIAGYVNLYCVKKGLAKLHDNARAAAAAKAAAAGSGVAAAGAARAGATTAAAAATSSGRKHRLHRLQ